MPYWSKRTKKILVLLLDVSMQVHIQEYKANTEFSPEATIDIEKTSKFTVKGGLFATYSCII